MTTRAITRISVRAKLLRGLADPSRLSVLESLFDGPKCVTEIIGLTGLSQPNASNHLACLRECGLVARQQQGRFVYYRITSESVIRLLASVGEVLEIVGESIEACLNYLEEPADA